MPKPYADAEQQLTRGALEPLIGLATVFAIFIYLLLSNKLELVPLSGWHDQQRFLELLLLAFIALSSVAAPPVPNHGSTYALLGLAFASCLLAPQPGWALAEVALMLGLILSIYWCRIGIGRIIAVDLNSLMLALLTLGAFSLVLPLIMTGAIFTDDRPVRSLYELFDGYSNRRFFSQTQSFLVPLLLLPAFINPQRFRWAALVITTLFWVLAFAVGTRAFYLAILVAAGFSWFVVPAIGRQWLALQCRCAVTGLVAYLAIFVLLPSLMGFSLSSDLVRLTSLGAVADSSGRVLLWSEALWLAWQHPMLGAGPMQFAGVEQQVRELSKILGLAWHYTAHPHNTVLQLLAEFGIPFTLILGWRVTVASHRLLRTATTVKDANPQLVILLITLVTAFVYSLLDGSLVMPYTQVLASLVIGWTLAVASPDPYPGSLRSPIIGRMQTHAIRMSALAMSIFLVWLAVEPFDRIIDDSKRYVARAPEGFLNPRFWVQGIINLPHDQRYPFPIFQAPAQRE